VGTRGFGRSMRGSGGFLGIRAIPPAIVELDGVDQECIARDDVELQVRGGRAGVPRHHLEAKLQAVPRHRLQLASPHADRRDAVTIGYVQDDIENTLRQRYLVHYMLLIFR
jgi:hypothetical protein